MRDKELLAIMAAIIDGADAIAASFPEAGNGMTAAQSVERAEQLLVEVEILVDKDGRLCARKATT